MDSGLYPIPCVVGSYYGTLDICPAPSLNTTATFHRCLLWIARIDSVFFTWSKLLAAETPENELLTPHKLHSTLLTLFSAIFQLACLIWYLVSYFPMGSSGLRLATTFGARRAAAWMTG